MKDLIMFSVLLIVCAGWLTYDREETTLRGFAGTRNAYSWLGVDQAWAVPEHVDLNHPQEWGFDLMPPVGSFRVVIIPEHKELCQQTPDLQERCGHEVQEWVP